MNNLQHDLDMIDQQVETMHPGALDAIKKAVRYRYDDIMPKSKTLRTHRDGARKYKTQGNSDFYFSI